MFLYTKKDEFEKTPRKLVLDKIHLRNLLLSFKVRLMKRRVSGQWMKGFFS